MDKKTRFIFITGGVLSSLGKGLAAASLGAVLKARGLAVTIQKLDPYLNIDPGTLNPFQHGEVFVTGADCPDKLCEKASIDKSGESIVCLPNRLSVTVEGENEKEVDVIL